MSPHLSSAAALLGAVSCLASPAFAIDVDPVLTVNGVSGGPLAVVPVGMGSSVQFTLAGTPGAPFALYLSAEAMAAPASGFFPTPWTPAGAGIHSPVHAVLDGIGSAYVANGLGLPAADFVPSAAKPFLRFDATGTAQFTTLLPAIVPLTDDDPAQPAGFPYGPGQPVPYALEEPLSLFLQVVAVDTQTLGIRVGNAVELEFLGKEFDATIALSIGADANPASATLPERQTFTTVVDSDLGDATLGAPTNAPDFAGSFGDATDVWMIQLAGPREAIATAADVGPLSADDQLQSVQGLASGLEVGTGEVVTRDNENAEFPRIRLPGHRQLFHWRNGGTSPPTYGFGVLFEETGTFRNLVPASFGTFSQTATISPWEVQVAVTPDGNRAVVVLDRATDLFQGATYDRVFLLNLEENGTFGNGQPIVEVNPSSPALWRRVYEESIVFTTDGGAGWAAWMMTSASTSSSATLLPDGLFRVGASQGTSVFDVGSASGAFPQPVTFERVIEVNEQLDTLCVIGGPTQLQQDVFAITNVTPSSWSVTNVTQFAGSVRLVADGLASDGKSGYADLSRAGTTYAGCRLISSSSFVPFAARTDGTDAGSVTDIVRPIASGGQFDLTDFPAAQGLHLTDDGLSLLFHQGRIRPGAASDASDLFVVDLASGVVRNLTRTLSGAPYDQNPTARYLGPWDLQNFVTDAPIVDYGGSFLSPDRRHRFLFHDVHLLGDDRFNVYAVDVEPGAGGASPSFDLVNVTGTTFEPSFGTPPPTTGAPDVVTGAGFFVEQTPSHLRLRRIGGDGPLRDFCFFTARLASAPSGPTEHLFVFDSVNPGPALRITDFGPSSAPIATSDGSRIRDVTPHPSEPAVAFVLHRDADQGAANQELVVLSMQTGFAPAVVPNPGSSASFSRAITAGSLHWLPGTKSALVWSEGRTPRPLGTTDGVTTAVTDVLSGGNPIDATPWFFTFADPTNPRKILADAPAGTARSAMIWSVR